MHYAEREGGRERGREGEREGGREGRREEGEKEGGRKEGVRKGGREKCPVTLSCPKDQGELRHTPRQYLYIVSDVVALIIIGVENKVCLVL